jgi:dTDP-4-amino-4,6-dideoxygalactose transaminase
MEGIQGLVLSQKLPLLDQWTEARREFAQAYQERLSGLPLVLPSVTNDDHVYHLYVVRAKNRDRLRDYLLTRRIETGLHYPVPLHAQPCFAHLVKGQNDYSVAQRYSEECLSLPLYTGMTLAQVDRVCDVITKFFRDR